MRTDNRSIFFPGFAFLFIAALSAAGCSKKEVAPPPVETPTPAATVVFTPTPEPTATPVPREVVSGKVTQVTQADSLIMLVGKKKVNVKVYGVVLPKKNAAILKSAKKFATRLVLQKKISVEVVERSKGRIVGFVTVSSGTNLGHELLNKGYASFKGDSLIDAAAAGIEDQAKAAKVGLWADPKKKKKGKR